MKRLPLLCRGPLSRLSPLPYSQLHFFSLNQSRCFLSRTPTLISPLRYQKKQSSKGKTSGSDEEEIEDQEKKEDESHREDFNKNASFHKFTIEQKLANTQKLFDSLTQPIPEIKHTYQSTQTNIQMSTEEFFSKNRHTYENFILLMTSQSKLTNIDIITNTYQLFKQRNFKPTEHVYKLMIKACATNQNPTLAKAYWTEMTQQGIEPTLKTYTEMVSCLAKSGLIDESRQIVENLLISSITPDATIFTVLINTCIDKGRTDIAWEIFRDMRFHGVKPDQITFNVMLKACSKRGEAERALRIFQEFESEGLTPLVSSYNCLIRAFSKRPDYYATALATYERMKQEGWQPNAHSYTALLRAAAETGDVRGAELIYREMEQEGHTHQLQHRSLLLRSLIRSHPKGKEEKDILFSKANALIEKSKTEGVLPQFSPELQDNIEKIENATLVQQDPINDTPIDAFLVKLSQMQQKDIEITERNPTLYKQEELLATHLELAVEYHRIPLALKIFGEIRGYGLEPSSRTYSLMLSLFCQARWKEHALTYHRHLLLSCRKDELRYSSESSDMGRGKVRRDEVKKRAYISVINLAVRCKDIELAVQYLRLMIIFEKLRVNNFLLDRELVQLARTSNRHDLANEISDLFLAQPVKGEVDWQKELNRRLEVHRNNVAYEKFE